MKIPTPLLSLLFLFILVISCKKEERGSECFPGTPTTRVITNKRAVVKLTATITEPVYLVEEGTLDSRLIPCNFPVEFYQHDLQVNISGEVKATQQMASTPCCAENLIITKISR